MQALLPAPPGREGSLPPLCLENTRAAPKLALVPKPGGSTVLLGKTRHQTYNSQISTIMRLSQRET